MLTLLRTAVILIWLSSLYENADCFGTNQSFLSQSKKVKVLVSFIKNQSNVLPTCHNCHSEGFVNDSSLNNGSVIQRRNFLKNLSLISGCWIVSKSPIRTAAEEADASLDQKVFVKGTVNLPPKVELPPDTSSSALYVTVRPNNPINVPKAILDGSNGKPPPVLSIKIPSVHDFPCEFKLTAADLTLEGNAKIQQDGGDDKFWWEGQDLIVSSRWDTDGVAATRDPTDLVGRSYYFASKEDDIIIQLQGRGFTGKLLTGKK